MPNVFTLRTPVMEHAQMKCVVNKKLYVKQHFNILTVRREGTTDLGLFCSSLFILHFQAKETIDK